MLSYLILGLSLAITVPPSEVARDACGIFAFLFLLAREQNSQTSQRPRLLYDGLCVAYMSNSAHYCKFYKKSKIQIIGNRTSNSEY